MVQFLKKLNITINLQFTKQGIEKIMKLPKNWKKYTNQDNQIKSITRRRSEQEKDLKEYRIETSSNIKP